MGELDLLKLLNRVAALLAMGDAPHGHVLVPATLPSFTAEAAPQQGLW